MLRQFVQHRRQHLWSWGNLAGISFVQIRPRRCPNLSPKLQGEGVAKKCCPNFRGVVPKYVAPISADVAQMCCTNFRVVLRKLLPKLLPKVLPKVLPTLLPKKCCPNRKRVFRVRRTTVCHIIARMSLTLFADLARTIWATPSSPEWQAGCCARTFF